MKKLLALLLVACAVILSGCLYLPQTTTITSTTAEKQPGKQDETSISIVEPDATEPETSASDLKSDSIEIIKEYTCDDVIYYECQAHIVVVKNVSDKSVAIRTNTLAYNENGDLISVADGYLPILEPGCVSVYTESFATTEKIAKYETTRVVSYPIDYNYGISELSYEILDTQNGKIVKVTNNGSTPISFVRGHLICFLNGNVVDYDTNFFMNDSDVIPPGETIIKQYVIRRDFDSIEFYLEGRG